MFWLVDIAEYTPEIGEPLSTVIGYVAKLDVSHTDVNAPFSKSPPNE